MITLNVFGSPSLRCKPCQKGSSLLNEHTINVNQTTKEGEICGIALNLSEPHETARQLASSLAWINCTEVEIFYAPRGLVEMAAARQDEEEEGGGSRRSAALGIGIHLIMYFCLLAIIVCLGKYFFSL